MLMAFVIEVRTCEDVRILKGFLPLMFDFDVLWNILLVAQNASFSLRWNGWSAGVQSRCFCLQTPSINSLTKLTNTLLLRAYPHSVCARVCAFDLSVRLCVCVCTDCIWGCFLGLKLSGGNAATRAEIQDEMRSSDCVLIGCRDDGQFQSQFLPDSQSTNNPPQGSAEGYNRMQA